jgi:hypothetical protein
MASHPILIACPEYRKLVRGWAECDETGLPRRADDGDLLLGAVRCNQHNGRCAQTLCALHRYNRRGRGTWYPDRVFAMPSRSRAVAGKVRRGHLGGDSLEGSSIGPQADGDSTFSRLA